MRPPHTKISIFHNEPPFHSCIYYSATGDEYQKFKLIISSSASGLLRSVYHTEPDCKEKYLLRPLQTADRKENTLPGLPQSERRNAEASSCKEKRRTVLCRRKEQRRKKEVSINDDSLGFFPYGRVLGYPFCYKSVWNKRAACIGTMQNKWGWA